MHGHGLYSDEAADQVPGKSYNLMTINKILIGKNNTWVFTLFQL